MQQNIDISTNNEMKNTITECISGNTIARMNPVFTFGFLSVSSFFSIKKTNIIFESWVTYS